MMDSYSTDELKSRLLLIRSNLPPNLLISLTESLPDCCTINQASQASLSSCGLSAEQIERLQSVNAETIDRDMAWLDNDGHGIIFYDSPNYPPQLLEINEPPYALFYIGDTDYLSQPQLAMVGSRTPTSSGQQIATDFAHHLSESGITITSGLAYGIDAASHKGSLKGIAGSIAVVANGLHRIYPKANTSLAQEIAANGCILSESPIGMEPHRGLFPRRNRIISGLSIGTLVVEAALKSGSLITSRYAMEQGREVFAIPGSIHNPLSKGCHQLIKSGAKLVESAADILEELSPLVNLPTIRHTSAAHTKVTNDTNSGLELDPSYQILLKHMEFEAVGIDELVERSNLEASEIASMLLILELQGHVASQNGRYTRISTDPAVTNANRENEPGKL